MPYSKYVAPIGMIVIAVVAFAVGLFASPLVLPPSKEADPVWARVTKAGKMVVGTEPGWPPYEYLNGTQIVGFEIELTELIADELNLTVEWRNMAFDAIIPAVQAGDIDLGVSGFSVKPARLEVVQFTMPHSITEGQVIMLQSRANQLGITTIQSLANLTQLIGSQKCGAQTGTTQEEELMQVAPSVLKSYSDYLIALQDMKRGAIDCIYAETPITTGWIAEAEEPIVIIFNRPYYPVAFVAHKDADTLVAKIDGVLAEIIASGQLTQLKLEWKC